MFAISLTHIPLSPSSVGLFEQRGVNQAKLQAETLTGQAPASRFWRTPRPEWRRTAAGHRHPEKSTPAGHRDSALGSTCEIIWSEDG